MQGKLSEVRIGFGDLVVSSQDSGIISRGETSVKNYSCLSAVTSGYSGHTGQALPTSEWVLVT